MKRPLGQLRIIGGQWRSRRVNFDAGDGPDSGVRPTPDRVRQTLFDWLAPIVDGARCVDLYAGSGALGLEALSRGASHVDFVERGAAQAAAIRAALQTLQAGPRAAVHSGDAVGFLAGAGRYDIAFVDPPYAAGLWLPTLAALRPHLAPLHRVYIEWPGSDEPQWPQDFHVLKRKTAGRVSYALAEFQPASA